MFSVKPLQTDIQGAIKLIFVSGLIFWEVTGDSGIPEISIFLIFSRFQNFDFFDFLGGLKILAGGYGAVLVGVSMM